MLKNIIKAGLIFTVILGPILVVNAAVIPFYQRQAVAYLNEKGKFYNMRMMYGDRITYNFFNNKKTVNITINGVVYSIDFERILRGVFAKIQTQLNIKNLSFSQTSDNKPQIFVDITDWIPEGTPKGLIAGGVFKARVPSGYAVLFIFEKKLQKNISESYRICQEHGIISNDMTISSFIPFYLRDVLMHELGHILGLHHPDSFGESEGHVGEVLAPGESSKNTDTPIMYSEIYTYLLALKNEKGRSLNINDFAYSSSELAALRKMLSNSQTSITKYNAIDGNNLRKYLSYMYGHDQLQFLGKTVKRDDDDPRLLPSYYVRYDVSLDKADSGYPSNINQRTWPGISSTEAKHISAAVLRVDGKKYYFFLDDGTYIRYDTASDKADAGYPVATSDGWKGISADEAKQITAVFPNASGSKYYIFLKNNKYLRYDISQDKVDAGYPGTISLGWPGISPDMAKNIDAVVINKNKTKYYMFMSDGSYLRYDISSDKMDSGYPSVITESNWPGMSKFRKQIKSVFRQTLSDEKMYFMMN